MSIFMVFAGMLDIFWLLRCVGLVLDFLLRCSVSC